LNHVHHLADAGNMFSSSGDDPQDYLRDLIEQVNQHPLVTVHLNTEYEELGGFVGKFTSRLSRRNADAASNGRETYQVDHGAVVVATGGREYRGSEYLYGSHPRIVTQQEFEALLAPAADPQSDTPLPASIVMIQCIGPAEQYCSRICCTVALKNALRFKELNPSGQVTVLFKDIRTFGFKERLYTEARRQGVLFVRYDDEKQPQVRTDDGLTITARDPILGQELSLQPDLLVLSMPLVPAEGTDELVSKLRVSVDLDGWFMEAHVKLRPVDFASGGIFMAGVAHYPKFLDETIVQAQAAAARAANILASDTMVVGGQVAVVDEVKCVGCLTCVRMCPYDVPKIQANLVGVGDIMGAAFIEPAVCQGCGSCVAECPAKAIELMHYTDAQLLSKVDALFDMIPADEIVVL
jgi:heterodisulfide reductase subunit A-like polyferredoxin